MQPLYLIAVIGTRLITVLSTLTLSYLLDPPALGRYVLVVTNALLAQMILGAWLTSIANRILTTDGSLDREGLSSIASALILVLLIAIATAAFAPLLVPMNAARLASVIALAFLLICYDTTLAIKNAAGDERGYSRLAMIRNSTAFLLSVSFVLAGYGFVGAVAGQILGTLLALIGMSSVVEMWKVARPSMDTLRALRRHISLGVAGAATLGIYIAVNAPSRNIMGHVTGVAGAGVWALCSDLFYGPLAVIGNAYGLSQIRLLYLAAQSEDENSIARTARDLFEFTLSIAIPYAIGGAIFGPRIVALVFPVAQAPNASLVVVPAILQGAGLLVLYSLASVGLARRRFGLIVAMVVTTAAAAMLGAWWGGELTRAAWYSALATCVVISIWSAWSATISIVRSRIREMAKILAACAALTLTAIIGVSLFDFPGGWLVALGLSSVAFVVAALLSGLSGFANALPPRLRTRLTRHFPVGPSMIP
ncbi:hypothetical protein ACFSC3_16910 [Sphingomonas floccifaciens]|uniref:Membrane protein involved in the export of O-antigen and teichoic acid n=1 Tax=Sphingomonas floccifaciens TaxID=1844115 RepID=A0ABW4NH58_9SPHN